jgi:hypothetical protein
MTGCSRIAAMTFSSLQQFGQFVTHALKRKGINTHFGTTLGQKGMSAIFTVGRTALIDTLATY